MGSFESILQVAMITVAAVKFGGDALLLWLPPRVTGAPAARRRCAGYYAMSVASKCQARGSRCGMAQAVPRRVLFFCSASHIELLPTGPGGAPRCTLNKERRRNPAQQLAAPVPGRCGRRKRARHAPSARAAGSHLSAAWARPAMLHGRSHGARRRQFAHVLAAV